MFFNRPENEKTNQSVKCLISSSQPTQGRYSPWVNREELCSDGREKATDSEAGTEKAPLSVVHDCMCRRQQAAAVHVLPLLWLR
jgi:hypothetical protein